MLISKLSSLAHRLHVILTAALLIGPLVTLGMTYQDEIAVAKRGAGMVLFVTLQRQSMS